ncbi:Protein-tyrosine phosphatase-like protein with PUB domain [Cryptosporidium felis]|nr:Protein-tyrosine phosphatase-like protein with PUB domain [Cryptosporidium felis]
MGSSCSNTSILQKSGDPQEEKIDLRDGTNKNSITGENASPAFQTRTARNSNSDNSLNSECNSEKKSETRSKRKKKNDSGKVILEVPSLNSKAVKEKIQKPWKSLESITFQWKEIGVEGTNFKVRYITPNMFFNLWAQSRNSNPFGNYGITFIDSQSFYFDVKVLEANTEEEEAMARLASKGALMKKTVIGALQPFRSFSKQSTTIYETSNEKAFKKINSTQYSDAVLRYSQTVNSWLLEQINNKVVVLFDHLWEGNASIRGDRVSHESQTFLDIMNCCSCRPERIYILAGGFASLSPRYDSCIDENPICSEFFDTNSFSRFPSESIPLFPILTHFCVLTCDIGILAQNNWDKCKDKFNISKIVNLTNDPEIYRFPKSSKIKYYSVPCYYTETPDYWGVVNIIRQAHHFRKSVLLVDYSGDYHSLNIVGLFLIELGYKPSEVVKFITERRLGFTFDGFILGLFEQVYEKSQSTPEKLKPIRPTIYFPIEKVQDLECEKKALELINELIMENSHQNEIQIKECLRNLVVLIRNVISFPNNPFYRVINLKNEIFNDSVGKFRQGVEILQLAGFTLIEKDGEKKLKLNFETGMNNCRTILSVLHKETAKYIFKKNVM